MSGSPLARRSSRGSRTEGCADRSVLVSEYPRHQELLTLDGRSPRQGPLGRQALPLDVRSEDVSDRERVGGGRHVVGGQALDRRNRIEDHLKLGCQVVQLEVAEVDPSQVCQTRDLISPISGMISSSGATPSRGL